MNLPLRRTLLNRETPFAFSCNRCKRCCRNKKIQVNPYEIARLAANLGVSTTGLLKRYTSDNGTQLATKEDGTCVFLDSGGCGVHRDRPLVCRLYPLGRDVSASGAESFLEIEPESYCKSGNREENTIEDYLELQGTGPFMRAADRYLNLFCKLCEILLKLPDDSMTHDAVAGLFRNDCTDSHGQGNNLMDIDSVVSTYCRDIDLPFPDDIEEKMSIHIQAIEACIFKLKEDSHEN